MVVEFVFGYWLVPTFITLVAFAAAFIFSNGKTDDWSSAMAGGLVALVNYGLAIIVSLVAWLIYYIII